MLDLPHSFAHQARQVRIHIRILFGQSLDLGHVPVLHHIDAA